MTNFVYYNRNPLHQKIDDCVCRAISTATMLNYNGVINLMKVTSEIYKCDELCVCCYSKLLEDILQYRVHICHNSETVSQIASKYKESVLIIRIDGHLTCALNGQIKDIWDCSDKTVDRFWIVN